ncbi:MAG: ABC transporter permease [Clostridia bacterium]|nr:ABC transporter permease [Clostridia bacterium]
MKNRRNLLPFEIHIAKRDGLPTWKRWVIRGGAILLALITSAIITIAVAGLNPAEMIGSMFNGTLATAGGRWTTAYYLVILLGISLAVTPAFKMRFWNIGAEGQVLMGAFAAAACMFYAGKMPFFNRADVSLDVKNLILIPCMLIAAMSAGALWGFIPAFFKSRWNTNETLFTLMMNYVALQLLKFMISYRGFKYPWTQNGTSVGYFNFIGAGEARYLGWLPEVAGSRYLIPILMIAALTALMFLYLRYSKHGYEIAVVGESERTAMYAGIKVNRVIIRTMILSGALCGLVGFLLVGAEGTISETTVDGRGYTAVMVSWMSQFNPIGMIFSSFLLVFMKYGMKTVKIAGGISMDLSFADILTGIILFFIIGCEFFINYQLQFSRHKKREV